MSRLRFIIFASLILVAYYSFAQTIPLANTTFKSKQGDVRMVLEVASTPEQRADTERDAVGAALIERVARDLHDEVRGSRVERAAREAASIIFSMCAGRWTAR